MDRIIIEVEDNTAKKWRYTNPNTKKRISEKVEQILNILMEKEQEDFWPFLEKVREQAEKKGFNDEILNQILSEK